MFSVKGRVFLLLGVSRLFCSIWTGGVLQKVPGFEDSIFILTGLSTAPVGGAGTGESVVIAVDGKGSGVVEAWCEKGLPFGGETDLMKSVFLGSSDFSTKDGGGGGRGLCTDEQTMERKTEIKMSITWLSSPMWSLKNPHTEEG